MKTAPKNFIITLTILIAMIGVTIDAAGEEKRSGTSSAGTSVDEIYKIGSGDILNIVTWKEPDFTMEVIVRNDGKITFPLLDDLQAAGKTSVEVKKAIEEGLREYIADPIVTVIVREPLSQKFYILGEVANTGEYPVIKDLFVLQAFALAGGFTEWASKNEIILLRREEGVPKIIRINYKDIIKGKNLDLDMQIQANDTIIVP